MKIKYFSCLNSDGEKLRCEAFGNTSAVNCPECGHTILFVALKENRNIGTTIHILL